MAGTYSNANKESSWLGGMLVALQHTLALCNADLEVLDKILGIFAQLAIEDGFTTSLQQQQLIKGLKDVNAGLVDGAHNRPACVDDVAHSTHHKGSSSGIPACNSPHQHPTSMLTNSKGASAARQ